jgi:hypothetical protein
MQTAAEAEMSPVEISVLLTQADRQAYLAAWTQRMQARSVSTGPLSWLTRRWQRPATPDAEAPKADGMVLGPCTLRFDAAGVRVRSANGDTLHQWTAITEGTATAHHLILWDESLSGLIVPLRDLPAGTTVSELQKRLDAVWTAAKNAKPHNTMRSEAAPDAKTASAA